ncbi:MAG: cyclopropane-fatty-acyl-phospholipid synthase [Planctomycetota bacterium]|nr:cyclopropane-fatty-acyl-phospholipid synthase [Planctomycetota bacterium]
MKTALRLVEKGLVPKPLLRVGIRKLIRQRLAEQRARFGPGPYDQGAGRALLNTVLSQWVAAMDAAPIALVPDKANEQHYEVPALLFDLCLGEHLKYSSGFYEHEGVTLDEAEAAMLALTAERAQLADGQDVLELGCGWGSLSLYMAERYPSSHIFAVSNSASQRAHILSRAAERGLDNLRVFTADMNDFELAQHAPGLRVDRVVSVEMFEHLRNWRAILTRVRPWMKPGALLFQHVFAHRHFAYAFEAKDESDWMSRHFFSGGMMPSHDQLDRLDIPFERADQWEVSGLHYARTSEHWLVNLEAHRREVLPVLAMTYGAEHAEQWYHRWRVFFLACAELFAWDGGRQWIVSHNLLRPV